TMPPAAPRRQVGSSASHRSLKAAAPRLAGPARNSNSRLPRNALCALQENHALPGFAMLRARARRHSRPVVRLCATQNTHEPGDSPMSASVVPTLRPLFHAEVEVGPVETIARLEAGGRRVVAITGGQVTPADAGGPFRGRILPV